MMEVLKCTNLQLYQALAPQFPRYQSQLKMNSMTCTDNWKVLEESQYCCQSCLGTVTSLCQNVKLERSIPPTLSSLFNEEFLELSYLELLKKCEESFCSITVTEQQAKHHEEATRDQADSKTWFQYRASRVTGSKFKAAAHTNKSSPFQSLIKTICYPEGHKFT